MPRQRGHARACGPVIKSTGFRPASGTKAEVAEPRREQAVEEGIAGMIKETLNKSETPS